MNRAVARGFALVVFASATAEAQSPCAGPDAPAWRISVAGLTEGRAAGWREPIVFELEGSPPRVAVATLRGWSPRVEAFVRARGAGHASSPFPGVSESRVTADRDVREFLYPTGQQERLDPDHATGPPRSPRPGNRAPTH